MSRQCYEEIRGWIWCFWRNCIYNCHIHICNRHRILGIIWWSTQLMMKVIWVFCYQFRDVDCGLIWENEFPNGMIKRNFINELVLLTDLFNWILFTLLCVFNGLLLTSLGLLGFDFNWTLRLRSRKRFAGLHDCVVLCVVNNFNILTNNPGTQTNWFLIDLIFDQSRFDWKFGRIGVF